MRPLDSKLPREAMSRYLLSEHVHLCVTGDQVVLLDLATDQYVALDLALSRSISAMVRGWPAVEQTGEPRRSSDGTATAQRMQARGLLTTDPRHGKDAAPATIPLPSVSLFDVQDAEEPAIRSNHVRAFAMSAVVAALKLRGLSIRRVVRAVTRRREARMARAVPFDPKAVSKLVAVFFRLRPFFFTGHNACLFESLALIDYLSRFGLFPHWTFGVQVAPFAAHCWVQQGDVVLNDSVENVRRYTPIMQA
jgi:Transglutaminase-like superfamily